MKKTLAVCMMAALITLTCGCEFTLMPQELYSLPKLPTEYTELDSRINAILAEGAEYAAPTSGRNIQPVQLEDLDNDGQEEAVAFFRNSNEGKPLKICIFSASEQSYEQTALIESSGTGIYSVAYSDIDGDGNTELIVGWRVAADQQALVVYSLRSGFVEELMRTSYVRYVLTDLERDGKQELVVLRSEGEEGGGVADYYSWQNGGLSLRTTARISITMAELSQQGKVTVGTLKGFTPAVFVTGVEDASWAVMDILTLKNGDLSNIVISGATGVSSQIAPFCSLYPADINSDGVTEAPWPELLLSHGEEESTYYRIDWQTYDQNGISAVVTSTYHDIEDGWYLLLPERWRNQITVTRSVASDEACVTFYARSEMGFTPFMEITAITGSNRSIKAGRGGRFILSRQADTIYTAELLEGNGQWGLGMTEDEVRGAFNLITQEWEYGNN